MTTALATSSSFSFCRLSLSLLMLYHPRLDQRTDRQKRKKKYEEKDLVIYSPKTYAICTHTHLCMYKRCCSPILLRFYICSTTTIIWPDLYKHDERETIYRLVSEYIRQGNHWVIYKYTSYFSLQDWSAGKNCFFSLSFWCFIYNKKKHFNFGCVC
jgi:hypothetical protein